jgi:hypothetical protein
VGRYWRGSTGTVAHESASETALRVCVVGTDGNCDVGRFGLDMAEDVREFLGVTHWK